MGGFVSDPEECGASARVWLDETRTIVGLAMARSIGDLAVKRVSVILSRVLSYDMIYYCIYSNNKSKKGYNIYIFSIY